MFKFKNETSSKVYLAFGYLNRKEQCWISEGWFHIEPYKTGIVYDKKLDNKWYYYYAHNSTSKWSGDTPFYVTTAIFTIKDTEFCDDFREENFQKIDVGANKSFAISLTDSSGLLLSEDEKEMIKQFQKIKK